MKLKIIYLLCALSFFSCQKLDLNPLSQGSSETWNSNADELIMSLNDLYREALWIKDLDDWTDDWIYRDGLTDVTNATINGQSSFILTNWQNTYKAISRANTVLEGMDRATEVLSESQINVYKAEARFVRACMYSYLLSHFRNVVYTDKTLSIEEANTIGQLDPQTLLTKIYEDFDFAATYLNETYSNAELKRATKGAALAMKARIALYMGDFEVAKTASKACIDLGLY